MIHRKLQNFIRAVSSSVAVTLLAAGAGHAQALFQPLGGANSRSLTLTAGKTPMGVATADFNHDGYPDMVVANYADTSLGTSGTMSVYLSSGPGTFHAPTTYPTCGGPTAVLAADLGLTGLSDIAITCNTKSSNVIEVFLNLGNGTFNPKVDGMTNIVLGTGMSQPVAITTGDFNSDGHPDLAVANMGNGTVSLFLSNAAVNFTSYTQKNISGLGAPTAITTGKFDASGNLGLAVTDRSAKGRVHILKGDGKGNFTPANLLPTGKEPNGIATADLNADGLPDLAVINAGDGTVTVLFGTGNDQFRSATVPIGSTTNPTGGVSIIALDVNGDGSPDLLSGNLLENNVALLQNNGNGTFQAPQYYAMRNGPAYLAVGDFNRTGKLDLAVTQQNGSSVSVLANNTLATPEPGGLNFLTPHTLNNGHGNMADSVAVADFNGDGNPDLAVSYLEDNVVRVLPGIGNSNFQTAVPYAVGRRPYMVAAGDLNLDGYADLVTTNTGDDTVSVLLNNGGGTGTFKAQQTYKVGHLPYSVAIGDLNGDGIPDLAVTNIGANSVSILWGQSGGTFKTGPTLATGINPYGVAIGDFRHNGQNDLAVTCYHADQLDIFLNNGNGTFQASPIILSTDSLPTTVLIGDFNRDGNLDVVTGNATANDVSFFAGNGDGTFRAGVTSFALNFPDSIAAGDVNGDGILDLVTVAPNFNQVAVLLGKGDGTFQQRVEFAAGQQPWSVALADFNYDGKLDFATANTVKQVNLTSPAKQLQYMTEFPATSSGGPSLNVALNNSGTNVSFTASPAQPAYNQPVTLTATIAAALGGTTPTGSVQFEDTNGMLFPGGPAMLSGGKGSLTVQSLGSGTHQITALYSGNATYQPHTATGPGFTVTVGGTSVVLNLASSSVPQGGTFTYTAIVGTPGKNILGPVGTVSLFLIFPNGSTARIDGPNVVVPSKNGTSSFSNSLTNTLPPGTYYLYAVFTPTVGALSQPGSSPEVMATSTAP